MKWCCLINKIVSLRSIDILLSHFLTYSSPDAVLLQMALTCLTTLIKTQVYVIKQTQTGAKRIYISALAAWTLSITVAQKIVSSSSLNTQLSKKRFVEEKL